MAWIGTWSALGICLTKIWASAVIPVRIVGGGSMISMMVAYSLTEVLNQLPGSA
jgi:hypothetical protein